MWTFAVEKEKEREIMLIEKEKDFFNWDSLHARLNSHYEA